MAVINVRDSMMRGARKYCEEQGFVTIHNMHYIVGMTGACENTDTLFTLGWY
jgi:asparaginyl-tRNA synthetase